MNFIDVSDIDFVKTEPKEKIFIANDNEVLRIPLGATMIKSPDAYMLFPKAIIIDTPTLLTLRPGDCDVSANSLCEIRVNNHYIFRMRNSYQTPFARGRSGNIYFVQILEILRILLAYEYRPTLSLFDYSSTANVMIRLIRSIEHSDCSIFKLFCQWLGDLLYFDENRFIQLKFLFTVLHFSTGKSVLSTMFEEINKYDDEATIINKLQKVCNMNLDREIYEELLNLYLDFGIGEAVVILEKRLALFEPDEKRFEL